MLNHILMTVMYLCATAPCSARALAQARPTMSCIRLFGASLSEPHMDDFAVEFVYIYIYIFFLLFVCLFFLLYIIVYA